MAAGQSAAGFLVDAMSFTPDPAADLNPWSEAWDRRRRRQGPLISPEMAVERAIERSSRENGSRHSSYGHDPVQLYTMADDCKHHDPEHLAASEIDDLVDDEHARRHPGDSWGRAGYRERMRSTRQLFAAAVLIDAMSDIYQDRHSGSICLDSPEGFACAECDKDDLEEGEGVEPGQCRRLDDSREAWGEFWWTQGDARYRSE